MIFWKIMLGIRANNTNIYQKRGFGLNQTLINEGQGIVGTK